jgi:general stress protein 26
MDSINKNQKEDNFENLRGKEAVAKIRELTDKAGSCFFCTRIATEQQFHSRPMAPEKIDDDGNFWFMSASDSHKNKEINADPAVQMLFQGSSYSGFLSLYGKATISTDKEKIKELWSDTMKTWFTGGIDDPRITVIKVTPTDGYYWDTKNGIAVATVKRLYGAIVGETYDDSIEGKISV